MYTVIIHDEYIRRSGKIVSIVVSIEIPLRHASSAANSRINERLGEGGESIGRLRGGRGGEEGRGWGKVSNAAHERVINGTFLDC